jgi:hypothetical protein
MSAVVNAGVHGGRSPRAVVVQPVRFTDNIEPMGSFLELLGLVRTVESERGGWLVLAGGGGMVALHAAASSDSGGKPGQTDDAELRGRRPGRGGSGTQRGRGT